MGRRLLGRVVRLLVVSTAVLTGPMASNAAPRSFATGTERVTVSITPSEGQGPWGCTKESCPPLPAGSSITYSVWIYPSPQEPWRPQVTGTVAFYDNGTRMATLPAADHGDGNSASAYWTYKPPPGYHNVHAVYSGDDYYASGDSGVCWVEVQEPAPATTSPPSPAPATTRGPRVSSRPPAEPSGEIPRPRVESTTRSNMATTSTVSASGSTAGDTSTSATSTTTPRSSTTSTTRAAASATVSESNGTGDLMWAAPVAVGGTVALAAAGVMVRRRRAGMSSLPPP